jgi:hypothetical protein
MKEKVASKYHAKKAKTKRYSKRYRMYYVSTSRIDISWFHHHQGTIHRGLESARDEQRPWIR